tara:strand:- start:285 stop:542 length:258 start_codon:yes stop_codon:yes gene_type:complete
MTKVIKFYASWCGPCNAYAETFNKVAEELKEEVEFLNIDVQNDNTGLTDKYKVTAIPVTVVIKDGEEKIHKGRMSEQALRQVIAG